MKLPERINSKVCIDHTLLDLCVAHPGNLKVEKIRLYIEIEQSTFSVTRAWIQKAG